MIFKTTTHVSRKELNDKIKKLEQRLKVATDYLQKISEGKQEFEVAGISLEEDEESKKFLETLLKTKEKLTQYARQDHERAWIAEGMSKFMEVIQGDRTQKDFYDKILTMIVRYTGTIQGGIFMLNDLNEADQYLELKACYAYSRKKFIDKRVGIGQGMLGQCFLEKETSMFTTVPNSYFDITSGLGEATPRFLLIVPLKYDQQVLGVIELASFEQMERYKIEFIEKLAENLASVALNIQHSARATLLYEESQVKARRLQEQEESLRQNIEELEATQEEMKRHQTELGQQTYLMKFIIDNIPFPIFVKDETGRYTLVNKSEAKLFNLPDSELLGKDDSYFVSNEDEWKVIQESDERVLASDTPLELPIQHFTTELGSTYVFKTTKIPFLNITTGKKNILGVSIDLTERLNLEKRLLHERSINQTHTLINLAGRQRMLTQKIAFYAEMVAKGKYDHVPEFRNAVDLFESSLLVIKEGGVPEGIEIELPLPQADAQLLPYIQTIEQMWRSYKEAAQKILYYITFHDKATHDVKEYEIQSGLAFIETHAEQLLLLNNELMLACIHMNEVKTALEV